MKKLIPFLLLTTILFGSKQSVYGQTSTMAKNIDSLMTYSHEHDLFNGTILVSDNNKVIYRKALGYADFEKDVKLIPESSFYLASVSKQFTTMAVMLLKENGKLSYEDKLSDYFPDFPDYADKITIRHMMTHTSGIPDHYGLNAYKVGLNNKDVYELLVKQEKLDFEPGSQYSYSNGGYVMLSMIVEKASGMPFHEYMKANIFDPLQMNNTLVYDQSEPEVSNRAIGYNASGNLDDYEIFTTGAGGIYSTVDDLFKWDQALYTDRLISQEALKEAFLPYELTNGEISYYGFGWGLNQENNWVGHSGGLSGFRTYLRRYLDEGDAFMILTNKGNALAMGDINDGLENILNGEDFTLPRIPISGKVAKLIDSDGIDKAIEMAKKLHAKDTVKYEYDEFGINSLGYSFLGDDKIDIALKLFKLNIDLRPNSSNTYDSYAEALLANKDTIASIKNYSISVKMNPNNQNGIDYLRKLGVDIKDVMPDISLTAEQLDKFVGDYELAPNFVLKILREGDQLFVHPTGQNKSQIFAASETKFYSKIVDAQVTFNTDDSGKVIGLTLHQNGDHNAPKMD